MGSSNYTMKYFFFWSLLCVLSTYSMTITSSSSSLVDDNAYIVYMEREKGAQQAHYYQNLLHKLHGTRTLGSVTNDAPASPGIEGLTPCEIADRYYSYCQKRYYEADKFCEIVVDNYNICHGLVDVPTYATRSGPPPPRHP